MSRVALLEKLGRTPFFQAVPAKQTDTGGGPHLGKKSTMLMSDFMASQSTQQLLYTLFRSEIGLMSVAQPTAQMDAVRESFSVLQKNIVDNLRGGVDHFELSLGGQQGDIVLLSYRTDAHFFKKLYEGIALIDCEDDTRALNEKVYPLVGAMVLGNEMLKSKTIALLQAHIRKYGDAVGKRIVQSLGTFNLSLLSAAVMPARSATNA